MEGVHPAYPQPGWPALVQALNGWTLLGPSGSSMIRLSCDASWLNVGDGEAARVYDLRTVTAVWQGEGLLWRWPDGVPSP